LGVFPPVSENEVAVSRIDFGQCRKQTAQVDLSSAHLTGDHEQRIDADAELAHCYLPERNRASATLSFGWMAGARVWSSAMARR